MGEMLSCISLFRSGCGHCCRRVEADTNAIGYHNPACVLHHAASDCVCHRLWRTRHVMRGSVFVVMAVAVIAGWALPLMGQTTGCANCESAPFKEMPAKAALFQQDGTAKQLFRPYTAKFKR